MPPPPPPPDSGDDDDIRLDRWFRRHYPDLGHGRLEKLIRKGQVRIDGARAKASTRLVAGQQVRVPPFGELGKRPKKKPARLSLSKQEEADLRARVIYRDDDVLAINKPAGLAVQGGSGTTKHLDAMLDALTFEGAVYGVPLAYKCIGLFYNKALLDGPPELQRVSGVAWQSAAQLAEWKRRSAEAARRELGLLGD